MDEALREELRRAAEEPATIDLTTVGRNSGQPRRIEIWLVNVDGRIVIGGTPGTRDWLANVRAEPMVTLHFKERDAFDVAATAVEVTDPATRREIWEHPSTRWYRGQVGVDDLVASAPTIELVIDETTG